MASSRQRDPNHEPSPRKPARTPEERENQLIALAHDRAEQQIRDGTASAQVITHFLKLGSSRERLEQQQIEHNNELLQAKRDHLASAARTEELFARAMKAFRGYSGAEELEAADDYSD